MKLIKETYDSWGAEVIFITSNMGGNTEMMEGCKKAGIPAFGTLVRPGRQERPLVLTWNSSYSGISENFIESSSMMMMTTDVGPNLRYL